MVRCWTTFSTSDKHFVLLLLLTSAWLLQGNVGFDRAEITELKKLLQNESSMRKEAEEEIANLKSELHQFTNPEVLDWLSHGFVEIMNCRWLYVINILVY